MKFAIQDLCQNRTLLFHPERLGSYQPDYFAFCRIPETGIVVGNLNFNITRRPHADKLPEDCLSKSFEK